MIARSTGLLKPQIYGVSIRHWKRQPIWTSVGRSPAAARSSKKSASRESSLNEAILVLRVSSRSVICVMRQVDGCGGDGGGCGMVVELIAMENSKCGGG